MFKTCLSAILIALTFTACSPSPTSTAPADLSAITNTVRTNLTKKVFDLRTDQERLADRWLVKLKLDDTNKLARLQKVIANHVGAVRDFHNASIQQIKDAAGITDTRASVPVDQELAADAKLPSSVHKALMTGLRQDLTEEQVDAILDLYTSGRFTSALKSFHAIVPDLTAEEETAIGGFLKQAREKAVDYKNKEEMNAIFEAAKAQCQQFLVSKGRNWEVLYQAYTNTPAGKPTGGDPSN